MTALAGAGASIVGGRKKKTDPPKPAIGSICAYGDWRDEPFVLEEATKNGNAIVHARELAKERAFMLKAVKLDGRTLRSASAQIQADKEVVMAAINSYGRALEFASAELRADRECVLLAVEKTGSSLQFAADSLRKDFRICLPAVSDDGSALQFVHPNLKSERRLVLKAVQQHSHALQFCTEALRQDREIVLASVKQCRRQLDDEFHNLSWEPQFHALQIATTFQNDREVVFSSVSQNGLSLEHACEEFRGDYDIVYAAVKDNAKALQYVIDPTKKIRKDPEILRIADRRPVIFREGREGQEDLYERMTKYNPDDDPATELQRRKQDPALAEKKKLPKSKFPKHEGGPGPGEGLHETPMANINSTLAAVRLRLAEILGDDLPPDDERTLKQVCRDIQLTMDGVLLPVEGDTYRRYGEDLNRTLVQAVERSFWEVEGSKGYLEAKLLDPPGKTAGRSLTWDVLRDMALEAKAQALEHKRAGRMQEAMFDYRRMQQYEKECIEKYQIEQDGKEAAEQAEKDRIAFEKAEKKRLGEEEAARKAKEEMERRANAKKKGKFAKADGGSAPAEAAPAEEASSVAAPDAAPPPPDS